MTTHQPPLPKSSYPPLTDPQLQRSIYVAILMIILLPPFVGGTLMGLVGFYPLPEFYLVFFSYPGLYVFTALLSGLALAPRAYRFIVNLTQLDHAVATSTAQRVFSHLPWYLFAAVALYSVVGALSADYSLEAMGVRQYSLREHLYNQFGLIPVVLITVFPIFFYFIDRLGRYLGPRGITVTTIPLWIKIVILGIVTPLLVDSLLIGYYYNRTGYFQLETAMLWISLLVLAAAGTWLAWRSLLLGISPLEMFMATRSTSISQHDKLLLEQSEARLNEAQHIAKIGSWELDLSNNHLIWSDEIFNIFEIDKTQFAASYEAFLDGIHPDDRDMVTQAYSDSLVNQAPYEIVYRLKMRDGRIKHIRENYKSFFDADGKPIRSVGTVQDINELHKTERELRHHHKHLEELVHERTTQLKHQNQRNELILGTTADGFFAADQDGRMIDINPAFCRMLGYSNKELLQLSIPDVEGNENPQEVAAHITKVFTDGHDRFDTCHRCKDGSLIDVEISVNLVELGSEKIFYAFVRDIAERKLSEKRLMAARDEAECANAAKSEFLSRMSHELRTPLNAILGFGQLLAIETEHPLNKQQSQDVHEILNAGNHLLELVNEVLDLSRIESGHLSVNLESVSIAPIIEACVAQLTPLASASDINTTIELKKQYAVIADQMRLKEVLLNLLSNAIKYNCKGGSIHLSCAPIGNTRLRISVRDTGRGIAANALPRLFKPFERMESAYDGIEGTGVGLALSKKLLDAMHGDTGVQSVLGEGSTFWFELPLAENATLETEVNPDAVTTSNDDCRKILYVEDKPSNQRLIQTVLATRNDIMLLDAANAEAGLDILANQHVDLILLDINLPGMDGFEALEKLKNNSNTRDIPVIALTANAMSGDIERGKAAGFVEYLTKPIDIARFLNLLDDCLP
jgi:PAS domain S-box-containing protein